MSSSVGLMVRDLSTTGGWGADLRTARERLGWKLPDVAGSLRIRVCHLESLENGNIGALPGTAYAVGFLRSYAGILGLDAEDVIRRFRREAAEMSVAPDLAFPVPMPKRGLPAGAIIMLSVLLSACAYGAWYELSEQGRLPAETVTAIPTRLAPLTRSLTPPLPIAAETAPSPPPQKIALDPLPIHLAISTAPGADMAQTAGTEQPPAKPVSATSRDASRIIVRASADAWIQVKARNGSIVLSRVLKAGETWPVPQQDDLVLTTGNAGGTTILVDGVMAPVLGGAGVVRHDIPLDADGIREGRLAANLGSQLADGRRRQ